MISQHAEMCNTCRAAGVTAEVIQCKGCKGTGRRANRKCGRCGAWGVVVQRVRCGACNSSGLVIIRTTHACGSCNGSGREPCRYCVGTGAVPKSVSFKFVVPAGVEDNNVYRYAGAGFSTHEGRPTDLYVRFAVLAKAPRR